MTKVISHSLIKKSVDIREVIVAVEQGYKHLANEKYILPQRLFSSTIDGGDYLYGAATNLDSHHYTVLSSAYLPWNKNTKNPIVTGHYLYTNFKTGKLSAILDGTDIVNYRTAAKSAVVCKYLAKKDAKTLGLIGLGNQAKYQAQAIATKTGVIKVIGYSRNKKNAQSTLAHIQKSTKLSTQYTTLKNVLTQSDVIVIGTDSKIPLITYANLHPGQLVISLAHSQEVAIDVVAKSRTYVDYLATAKSEFGPVKGAVEAKQYAYRSLTGDLTQLVTGKIKGRTSDKQIIYFQSLGVMHENLATVEYLYQKLKHLAPSINLD